MRLLKTYIRLVRMEHGIPTEKKVVRYSLPEFTTNLAPVNFRHQNSGIVVWISSSPRSPSFTLIRRTIKFTTPPPCFPFCPRSPVSKQEEPRDVLILASTIKTLYWPQVVHG